MRHVFTQAESRKGGRASAQKLTHVHRSAGGKARAKQATFRGHNQAIASSGYWSWSVKYMRGTTGLKLAMPFQIHYLRPEQLRGPDGKSISPQEQRLLFGLYVSPDRQVKQAACRSPSEYERRHWLLADRASRWDG